MQKPSSWQKGEAPFAEEKPSCCHFPNRVGTPRALHVPFEQEQPSTLTASAGV